MKCPGVAKYELSFYSMWSNETHPDAFPPMGGQFSPWIGASHNMNYTMFDVGMLASPGVEFVAETGNTTLLEDEITMRIMYNKTAWKVIKQEGGPTDGSGAHKTGIEVEVTADYPLVSLMSMLAPSPDWFVGVPGENLCKDGMWLDVLNITSLPPWDAGTDSGDMFNSTDLDTDPAENITRITKATPGTPFMGSSDIATLGTLMFKRVDKPKVYTCSGEQKYQLKFEGMWSNERQPVTDFPDNAHFSKLIGCTHKYNFKFWSPMTMASQGVKQVAETGNEATLYDELEAVKSKDGFVFSVFKAGAKTDPTSTTTVIITAKDKYSKVSVIAMIAPSPDWFVGVDSVELCGDDGKWKDSVSARPLHAWDAGTDSGTMFKADDMETKPKDVIKQITKESNTELMGAEDIKAFAEISFVKYTPPPSGAHSISGSVFFCLSVAFFAISRFLY